MPGHVPFISALRPGVLVYRIKNESFILAVSEGVLEVARGSELAKSTDAEAVAKRLKLS